MDVDQPFLKRLGAIAKLVGFEIDKDIYELYDRVLAPIGYQRLCDALDTIALDIGPGMAFPSIRQIKEVATGERKTDPSKLDDGAARIAAALVIEAVSKFGSIVGDGPNSTAKLEKLKVFVGELGWESVKAFGNWNNLCATLTYENTGTIQAQLREFARAKIERRAAGLDAGPPGLDAPRLGANGPRTGLAAIGEADLVAAITPIKR